MKEIKLELPIVDLSGVCESMNELKKAVEEYNKREVIVRLGTALGKSGVKCSAIIEGSDEEVILDFSEHDKMVAEEKDKKISELEKQIGEYIAKNMLLRQRCKGEAVEFFDRNMFGSLIISSPPLEDSKRISELEDRHQSDCIRINQLLSTIDVLTERYQKLREVHGL